MHTYKYIHIHVHRNICTNFTSHICIQSYAHKPNTYMYMSIYFLIYLHISIPIEETLFGVSVFIVLQYAILHIVQQLAFCWLFESYPP